MLADRNLLNLTLKYQNVESKTKVYSAYHQLRLREVAIKEIECRSEEDANAYLTEGELMIQAKHPNVCECYTAVKEPPIGQGSWHVLLEMEKVDHDLHQEINERKATNSYIPEPELFNMMLEMIKALAFLQQHVTSTQNLAHRDIKPHNVFITEDRCIKLGDFGSSREIHDRFTMFTMQGTPFYLSPKIREAYGKFFDVPNVRVEHDVYKSDMFSLGMTMLHAMILSPPNTLVYLDHLQDRIEQTLTHISTYSQGLISYLRLMLLVDESQRPDFITMLSLLDGEAADICEAKPAAEGPVCCTCAREIDPRGREAVWMDCRELHGFCSSVCADSYTEQNAKGNLYLCPICGSRNTLTFKSKQSADFERIGQQSGQCSQCQTFDLVFALCHPLCLPCAQNLISRSSLCPSCNTPLPSKLVTMFSS